MIVSPKFALSKTLGFGIYVHWPFCETKCPYCDFNSYTYNGKIDEAEVLSGYVKEISYLRYLTGPRSVTSIFIGGGTPSLMLPSTIEALLRTIQQAWHVETWAEITLEANPSSVELNRFHAYRSAGINRLSLGVQALNDVDLKKLGRLHTAHQAMTSIDIAASTFPKFSFDLIYSRQDQNLNDWYSELSLALSFYSQHLSIYQLTIEENTLFAEKHRTEKLRIPGPELADDLYELTQQMTTNAGMPGYEISNHAVPGQESQHNLLYWRYGEYAGVGPGAHGRIILNGRRFALFNEHRPVQWLAKIIENGNALVEFSELSQSEQADELILMGLRITEGINLERLACIGGVKPKNRKVLELIKQNALIYSPNLKALRATKRGRLILNKLVLELATSLETL
ncbi:MAG: Heme chaperone HemW [Hyphomicrobiaceae bacterium hypho_1]